MRSFSNFQPSANDYGRQYKVFVVNPPSTAIIEENKKKINQLSMQRRMQTLQSEITQLKEQSEAKNRKDKLDQWLRLKKFNKEFNAILKLTTGSNPTTLNFDKFKLFSTNMGLLTQAQSNEESDERALIYDIWKCLSRVYPDGEIISVKNLRLILIAIIGLEENSKNCATTPV